MLPPTAHVAGRIAVRTLLVVLVLVVLAGLWIAVRGYWAVGHVRDAQQAAAELTENITDTAVVADLVEQIQADTAAADRLTSDPIWRLGERVPYAGAQLRAVGEATSAVSDMSDQALGPLVDVAAQFSADDLTPSDGRIDTTALVEIRAVAERSSTHMKAITTRIDRIDRRGLLTPLADELADLREQVHRAAGTVDGVHRASILMPAMLGEEGQRSYLVIVQNNAEWRSLGGLAGAMFVAETDDGRIELTDYAAGGDFDRIDEPVVDLPESMLELFRPNPATHRQNVTQIPDFAQSAQIAQAMWTRHSGQQVDGVLSIDPVTLAYLLEATGPVDVPAPGGSTREVTSQNAVDVLLNEVYIDYSFADQDKFFSDTTDAVFEAVFGGQANPRALLSALTKAAEERRVLIWSADEAEQSVLDGTRLQGALPMTDQTITQLGVYLNDGTGSKLSYYMSVEAGAQWCSVATDLGEASVQVTLTNDAPEDVTSLPESVTGAGYYGTEVGQTRNLVYFYLPSGTEIVADDVTGDAPFTGFGRGEHDGREVLTWESVLAPGESTTATVRIRTPWTPHLELISTPTIPGATTQLTSPCTK